MDAAERKALADEWRALARAPGPPDRRAYGCMVVLIVLALATLGPWLVKLAGLALPRPVAWAVNSVLILAFLAGLAFAFLFGSGRFAHAVGETEAAIAWLAAHAADPAQVERRRHEAVRLLYHAYCSDGPTTSGTLDVPKAREQLGAALANVIEVERALLADPGIYPVFTSGEKPKLPG